MDCARAHAVTLWCAALAKAHRGLLRIAPKDVSLAQLRALIQLGLPGCERLGRIDLARALVMKPGDASALLDSMEDRGLVEACGADPRFVATEKGRFQASEFYAHVEDYFAACIGSLSSQEVDVARELMRAAVMVPGGFYERRAEFVPMDRALWPAYCLLAFSAVFHVVVTASKRSTGLSFTDFRFLLELYPKKRSGEKTHRAKDMVRFLRTGRSYVTTASMRLEEQGYISRIPDDSDARGVLFQLEPSGYLCVQDAVEDVQAVLVAFYGDACESRAVLGTLKKLLVAEDSALDGRAVA